MVVVRVFVCRRIFKVVKVIKVFKDQVTLFSAKGPARAALGKHFPIGKHFLLGKRHSGQVMLILFPANFLQLIHTLMYALIYTLIYTLI